MEVPTQAAADISKVLAHPKPMFHFTTRKRSPSVVVNVVMSDKNNQDGDKQEVVKYRQLTTPGDKRQADRYRPGHRRTQSNRFAGTYVLERTLISMCSWNTLKLVVRQRSAATCQFLHRLRDKLVLGTCTTQECGHKHCSPAKYSNM
eukprot:scpid91174/ scgid25118/ 